MSYWCQRSGFFYRYIVDRLDSGNIRGRCGEMVSCRIWMSRADAQFHKFVTEETDKKKQETVLRCGGWLWILDNHCIVSMILVPLPTLLAEVISSFYLSVCARAFLFRKKYSDSIFRNGSIFSIWFSTSLPYRLLSFTITSSDVKSTLLRHHESLSQLHKDVGCDVSCKLQLSSTIRYDTIVCI